MPKKKSGKEKNLEKKSGRNTRKAKKRLEPERGLLVPGISTRKMSTRSLKNNFTEQFSDQSTLIQLRERAPPLMAAKNINKLPLRKSQSRDPKKLTSVKKESISRRKAPAIVTTKTATNLRSVRKETIRKKPIKKSESKDIVAPLKAKIQKKLKDKMETKKLALAQKKKGNKKQVKFEIKAVDSNAMKKIYSVEILPVKCTDVGRMNPSFLPGMKTYADFNNYSQRLASTVGMREFDNEMKSNMNPSIQPATSRGYVNALNSDYPDTAVPMNQGLKKTRTAHCIHARDTQAIQGNVDEQLATLPEISNEVRSNRPVTKNASNSGLKKSAVKPHQLKKKMQMNERLTTTLPEALASWVMDFYANFREPSEEKI